jgi:hypothetical protein
LREYNVPNVTGVIITSNHKVDGIFLPADDRRHFVAWSDLDKEDFDPGYWQRLWAWYGSGGDRHVAAYLAELDLSGFDPKAPPPKTQAFWEIVDASRAPEDGYVAVRNDGSKDGRWKVCGRNQVIYAKATLSVRDRIIAARKLAGW